MVGFFYTRQFGPDGQILCGEGAAEGTSLRELIRRERPPLRATLELGAALGDLLCIAQEDGAVHGGLSLDFVMIDEYGDVSIQGLGVPRDGGAAPERRGDLPTADVFGVGVVIYEAISGTELPRFPADADAHDDAVVSAVLDLDFSKVQGKKWLDEVRRFVARLLAWAPEDRPAALDAANVLGSVAAQVPGDGVDVWARRALTRPAPLSKPAPTIPESVPLRALPEILDQPLSLTAPFKPGGVRKAPASKGESTSFWSRERIAEMLSEEDDDEDAPPPPPRLSASKQGRLTAEVELSRSSLDTPRRPDPPRSQERLSAPAPVQFDARPEPSSSASRPMNTRDVVGELSRSDASPRAERGAPRVERSDPPPRMPEAPRPAARPAEPVRPAEPSRPEPVRPTPERPVVISEGRRPAPAEPEPAEGGSGKVMFAAGGLVFFLIALCGGGTLIAGGWYWWSTHEATPTTTDVAPTPEPAAPATAPAEPAPATPTDPSAAAPAAPTTASPSPTATPTAAPTTKATTTTTPATTKTTTTPTTKTTTPTTKTTTPTTTTTKPATTTTTPTTTTTKATTTPTKTTTSGPFTVRFNIPGQEGKISCGDGQVARFSGATNLSFESNQSCRIDAGGMRTVVTVSKSTTVTCSTAGGGLSCSGGG